MKFEEREGRKERIWSSWELSKEKMGGGGNLG